MQEGIPIVLALKSFVDTYKAMEETKLKLANDHMALV